MAPSSASQGQDGVASAASAVATASGEAARVDLELATEHYRGEHMAAKQGAGFKIYAERASFPPGGSSGGSNPARLPEIWAIGERRRAKSPALERNQLFFFFDLVACALLMRAARDLLIPSSRSASYVSGFLIEGPCFLPGITPS